MVAPSDPENINVLFAVSVLPEAIVSVFVPLLVIVRPLTVVKVGAEDVAIVTVPDPLLVVNIFEPAPKVIVPPCKIDEFGPVPETRVNKIPPVARQVVHVSVIVLPKPTVPPPASGPVVLIPTDEFAKLALVMPALPDKFELVSPVIVFDPAAIVLLVKVSVDESVIYPELLVH